ncbi:hypothetical protein KVR01_012776 [Diaporthe batatas]|uniref:uncharacterized protein n=1 Tax=Diaporthe batatas TaxID=748121 RepID=UPI001D04F5CC|nr:uncharacterized protein KVR01_012776 [Diaporthe batatas]KAG8157392.1 hypothetical protein KVR01_012776 [Diaporthe batatas]
MHDRAPPYDPELAAILAVRLGSHPTALSADTLPEGRKGASEASEATSERLRADPELQISGHMCRAGRTSDHVPIVVVEPTSGPRLSRPCLVYYHPGARIMGDAYTMIHPLVEWTKAFNAVTISVGYRLAPEHPGSTATEDAYAALQWVWAHTEDLAIDRGRIVLVGFSAGGGLAAGVALMARDRNSGPRLCGQVLVCPMLDDRSTTISARQYPTGGSFSSDDNKFAWGLVLAARAGTDDVSVYDAPARAQDLTTLPPAYIEAGSAEPFRDEAVQYASRMWECGGQAELHIWPGAPHSFNLIAPEAAISKAANETRLSWLKRALLG